MTATPVEERVRQMILEQFEWNGSHEQLTSDYPLIENHVLDSLDMMKLISLLEGEFSVEVGDEDLVAENFGTIGAIARFVAEHRP